MRTGSSAIIILLMAYCTPAQMAVAVDVHSLEDAGTKSAAKYAASPSSWNTVLIFPGAGRLVLSRLRDKGRERLVLSAEAPGNAQQMLRLVARNGAWYTDDENGKRKFRPYEYPAPLASFYLCLARSNPVFLNAQLSRGLGELKNTDNGVATFVEPYPAAQAGMVQKSIDGLESMIVQNPNDPRAAQSRQLVANLKKQLEAGITTRVDIETGLLLQSGGLNAKFQVELKDFKFLDKANDSEFAFTENSYTKFDDDPTQGNLQDLMLLQYSPQFLPGQKDYDLDGELMDVSTSRFRRVPYKGALSWPSCFLSDHKSVVVSGTDMITGTIRPVEINLSTRENRPLGGKMMQSGMTFGAAVSPDGKKIVVCHKDATTDILEVQVCVIDLATNESQAIGKPMDTSFVNWIDDQHFLLIRRRYADMTKKADTHLVMMDMAGHILPLAKGDHPIILADRKTVLFQDDASKWNTCNIDGSNIKPYAGGMAGYGFPAPAPDGKRIVMIHFQLPAAPEPWIFDLGQSNGRRLTTAKGIWATPAWN